MSSEDIPDPTFKVAGTEIDINKFAKMVETWVDFRVDEKFNDKWEKLKLGGKNYLLGGIQVLLLMISAYVGRVTG